MDLNIRKMTNPLYPATRISSSRNKTSTIQEGYGKFGTHARVLLQNTRAWE